MTRPARIVTDENQCFWHAAKECRRAAQRDRSVGRLPHLGVRQLRWRSLNHVDNARTALVTFSRTGNMLERG